jgi:hypothetical protein
VMVPAGPSPVDWCWGLNLLLVGGWGASPENRLHSARGAGCVPLRVAEGRGWSAKFANAWPHL